MLQVAPFIAGEISGKQNSLIGELRHLSDIAMNQRSQQCIKSTPLLHL